MVLQLLQPMRMWPAFRKANLLQQGHEGPGRAGSIVLCICRCKATAEDCPCPMPDLQTFDTSARQPLSFQATFRNIVFFLSGGLKAAALPPCRFQAAIGRKGCHEECQDQLEHVLSCHLRARHASSERKADRLELETALQDAPTDARQIAVRLHHVAALLRCSLIGDVD